MGSETVHTSADTSAADSWTPERLQAEVRAQYVFLETIVNTAPSLLMSLDPDGRIANFNTACELASGYENVEDVRHEYFWDVFISPAERDVLTAYVNAGGKLREESRPSRSDLGEHVRQPARRGDGDRVVDRAAHG